MSQKLIERAREKARQDRARARVTLDTLLAAFRLEGIDGYEIDDDEAVALARECKRALVDAARRRQLKEIGASLNANDAPAGRAPEAAEKVASDAPSSTSPAHAAAAPSPKEAGSDHRSTTAKPTMASVGAPNASASIAKDVSTHDSGESRPRTFGVTPNGHVASETSRPPLPSPAAST